MRSDSIVYGCYERIYVMFYFYIYISKFFPAICHNIHNIPAARKAPVVVITYGNNKYDKYNE
jgi:hypothetical protein